MALNAACVFEVRTGGSDTNAGFFKTGATGTDWSLQDSPQYSVTDGVAAGTTTLTSATANFGTDVVGNGIYVQGGTGSITAGWYEITARTNSTTITVDRSTGLTAGTGVTLKIGGALASPGQAAAVATVSDMKVWVKSGTYNITTSTAGSGGPVVTAAVRLTWRGYDATRGDHTGTRPTLVWTAAAPGAQTYCLSTTSGVGQLIENIAVDGNSVSNVSGINVGGSFHRLVDCVASNCNQTSMIGIRSASNIATITKCKAVSCTTGFTGASAQCFVLYCSAITCTTGYSGIRAIRSLAHQCVTAGFADGGQQVDFVNCTSDSTSSGSGFVSTSIVVMINCLSTNSSAYGLDGGSLASYLFNFATYNNTSGRIDVTGFCDENPITLSADPYVNLAGDDFRPNTTAGGGAALRAAGIGVYGQTDNVDVGAVQHTDSAAGGLLTGNLRGNMQ